MAKNEQLACNPSGKCSFTGRFSQTFKPFHRSHRFLRSYMHPNQEDRTYKDYTSNLVRPLLIVGIIFYRGFTYKHGRAGISK